MKKIILVLLMSAAVCFVSACSSMETEEMTTTVQNVTESDSIDTISSQADTIEEKGYMCVLDNGISLEMGAVLEDVPSVFGEPISFAEAPSCIHEGTDKVYTYNGYTLTTSPDAAGINRIYEVSLLSDAIALEGGVTIGSSLDVVVRVFGEEYTDQFGVLQYTLDGANMSIVLDADACVSSLVITANME